jgi:hypothetical protein
VLNDVDQSLRSLIQAAVPSNGGLPLVSFESPTADWASGQDDPVINLFLYDVREDLDGRSSDEIDVRDHEGNLIGRQPPPRQYNLSYLVSAWSKDAEAEHQLLGAILASVPDEPVIPERHLAGRLAEQGMTVRIKVGIPLTGANTWDLWSALGSPPRTAIEIVVTAPLLPELRTDLAPPAIQFDLGMHKQNPGEVGPPETTPGDADEPGTATEAARGEPSSKPRARGKRKAEEPEAAKEAAAAPAVPELEARPGKRWSTFRVREHAVPVDSDD